MGKYDSVKMKAHFGRHPKIITDVKFGMGPESKEHWSSNIQPIHTGDPTPVMLSHIPFRTKRLPIFWTKLSTKSTRGYETPLHSEHTREDRGERCHDGA